MMEVGAVIAKDGSVIHWHLPPNRTSVALPDSRSLWDILWENRARLAGFAHSHPGSGLPGPSYTDVTTFAAIESALGVRLDWWITSTDHLIGLKWKGPGPHEYVGWEIQKECEPRTWIAELRRLSYK
jgi:hypothetical protein